MEFTVEQDHWRGAIYGTGNRLLIAFHGYGQTQHAFRHLIPFLSEDYTVLSIDLAYHGENKNISASSCFNDLYVNHWLKAILNQLNFQRASLIGFSIGSRIALFIASVCPGMVDELCLLAPDGMPTSKYYRLLTSNRIGINFFKQFVTKPAIVGSIIRMAIFTHLLDTKTGQYFLQEIETEERRRQLYETWTFYRKSIPDYSVLKKSNLESSLKVTSILGRYDAVIPYRRTKWWIKSVFPLAALYELELGHNLLSEKAGKKIADFAEHKKSG